MQSITTRYYPPSAHSQHGRIKAISSSRLACWYQLPAPHPPYSDVPHREAARTLASRLDWHGTLAEGFGLDERSYVYVFVGETFEV